MARHEGLSFGGIVKALAGMALATLAGCETGSEGAAGIVEVRVFAHGVSGPVADGTSLFLGRFNTENRASGVMSAPLANPFGAWRELDMGPCALASTTESGMHFRRGPTLSLLPSGLWLQQGPVRVGASAVAEHSLCRWRNNRFLASDERLRWCGEATCESLWGTELKERRAGNDGVYTLYTNAGAGQNLLVSEDEGFDWRAILGSLEPMACTHQVFEIAPGRLWVGGECPLDFAYLRAYAMNEAGTALASPDPLPIKLPELENRNIHFIQRGADGKTHYAGVEGGLLRSVDGGAQFDFVMKYTQFDRKYPYIQHLRIDARKPAVVWAAGFDKVVGHAFLARSEDGGATWRDISDRLPSWRGTMQNRESQITGMAVTSGGALYIAESLLDNTAGRLLVIL